MSKDIIRIEVIKKRGEKDPAGDRTKETIKNVLGLGIDSVKSGMVYTINADISEKELDLLKKDLFSDPINETIVKSPDAMDFDWLIEVAFKPGVKDSWGDTCKKHGIPDILKRKLGEGESVHTSRQFYIKAKGLKREDAERIARDALSNEVIENFYVFSKEELAEKGIEIPLPIIGGRDEIKVETYDLDSYDDSGLLKLSKERLLALNKAEMLEIKKYFSDEGIIPEREKVGLGREATDAELEVLGQTWSGHCKHKRFNATIEYSDEEKGTKETIESIFKTCIRNPSVKIGEKFGWLLSSFHDNAGVVAFNERISIADKIETHNAPSALEPYGGAITGIVGVNRDVMGTGLGAKPTINVYAYCFGNEDYEGSLPRGVLHPKRIRAGVHKGVIDGGNQSGIPLGRGREVFDERFMYRPLVYCGTIGIMPREIAGRKTHDKTAKPGDVIIMAGGRIGKDGIHGATFSSDAIHKESPVQAVQIGDPITQKMMGDFLLEARDKGLYRCITDNGAGGLSSSVGEMAQFTKGCELDLKRAPLKYHGLQPWEILLSEAQERMTLAVPPENIDEFLKLAKDRDVEVTALGKFTDTGKFHVTYGDKTVCYLDMEFLHEGIPEMKLKATWKKRNLSEPDFEEPGDLGKILLDMLAGKNLNCKEHLIRQYDHEVKGFDAVKPLVGKDHDFESDATVYFLEYDSREGLAMAEGLNPYYSDIDAYAMAQSVADEALRRIIATGGKLSSRETFMYGLDNFCWNIVSDEGELAEHDYAQLVRANKGLCDYYTAFEFPLISGKDSMRNVYRKEDGSVVQIPATLLVSVRGKVPDVSKCVTLDAKKPGDLVYVLGETRDELGASEYYRKLGHLGANVPGVDTKKAKKLYGAFSEATERELVNSAHTPALGGLGVAFAKVSMAGGFGLDIDLGKVPREGVDRNDRILFSESNSRFVVTISKEKRKEFENIMKGNSFAEVGVVTKEGILRIKGINGDYVIEGKLDDMKKVWKTKL